MDLSFISGIITNATSTVNSFVNLGGVIYSVDNYKPPVYQGGDIKVNLPQTQQQSQFSIVEVTIVAVMVILVIAVLFLLYKKL